jgi:mannose-1-phosphate guanylyltransferase
VPVQPVILCGGVGSRLFPLSTPERPKQFLPLMSDQSMLVDTLDRARLLSDWPPILVGAVDHVESLKAAGGDARIVLEPVGRGTAPALAVVAQLMDPADVMLVMPSDHYIEDLEALASAVNVAVSRAEQGELVCFGIGPNRPDPNYGYIRFDNVPVHGTEWSRL